MHKILAGLFVTVLLASPAMAMPHPTPGLQLADYNGVTRPIPSAVPVFRDAEIATAAPAAVLLVQDRPRHRRHRHHRSRRHDDRRAGLPVLHAAWLA